MSSVPNEEHGVFPTVTVQIDDFEVSYLGEGPSPDLICLGSDDGRLLLTSVGAEIRQGPHVPPRPCLQASDSCEAINGAAFIGKHIAVSTRNAISLFIVHPSNRNEYQRAVFPAGITASSGRHPARLSPLSERPACSSSCQKKEKRHGSRSAEQKIVNSISTESPHSWLPRLWKFLFSRLGLAALLRWRLPDLINEEGCPG